MTGTERLELSAGDFVVEIDDTAQTINLRTDVEGEISLMIPLTVSEAENIAETTRRAVESIRRTADRG